VIDQKYRFEETEAKHVFDALDTSKDKSMHFGRKGGKDDGAAE